MYLRKYLSCPIFLSLGFFSLAQAANEEDIGPHNAFPRAYGALSEKSIYHQNRVRSMKQDLNDYGGRVYDLRRRFDLIFKNRDTQLPPPGQFEIGEAVTWRERETGSRVTYQGPKRPHRVRGTDPWVREVGGGDNPPPTGLEIDPVDEKSPLAFVVEGPGQKPRAQIQESTGQRKFEYYILPRFGMSLPADSDYKIGLGLAVSGGVVRDDWMIRIGDFGGFAQRRDSHLRF